MTTHELRQLLEKCGSDDVIHIGSITKCVEGDIVAAMDAAVKWARDIGARRPLSDNDNDSGEVFFQAGGVRRTIRVRTNPGGTGFVLIFY